jgi:hypothetical protein
VRDLLIRIMTSERTNNVTHKTIWVKDAIVGR